MVMCCAYGCSNEGVHRFPANSTQRKNWTKALKRQNFEPTKSSRLCSSHFQPSDYEKEGFHSGLTHQTKRLKRGAIPSIFSWKTESKTAIAEARSSRIARRAEVKYVQKQLFREDQDICQPASDLLEENSSFPEDSDCVEVLQVCDINECAEEIFEHKSAESDSDRIDSKSGPFGADIQNVSEAGDTKSNLKNNQAVFTIHMFKDDDEGVQFYTGLESYNKFMLVYHTVCPEVEKLKYRWGAVNILPENALFLTLMKLRRNRTDYELSRFFGVSKPNVSNIFVTWVNFLDQLWSMLDVWPSREIVNFYMPGSFKQSYPSTRVIVDATEFPISKPSQPAAQQATFSTYKNRNTAKVLVGATPGGVLSYKSDAYGGATSDRQIVERSNLVQKCDSGDTVMADRGFTVQDLFAPQGVTINMPNFLKGQSQLKASTVLKDRKLASKRVHIERIIGLIKTYKILVSPLSPYFVPLASKIFSVCFMLCNFREGIMRFVD